MKKYLLMILLFLNIPIFFVQATPPDLYYGMTVVPGPVDSFFYDEIEDTYRLEGHFDLLIKTSDLHQNQILNEVSELYQELFPFYHLVDYLNDSEWMSYLAYMKGASYTFEAVSSMELNYVFAYISGQRKEIKEVKVVYFNSEGQTIFITNPVVVDHAKFYEAQSGESHLYVDMETETLTSHFQTHFNTFIIFFGILYGIIAIVLVMIKIIIGEALKTNLYSEKLFLFVSWGSYMILFTLLRLIRSGAIDMFNLRYLVLHTWRIVIFLALYLVLETMVLYVIFKKNKKVKTFVLKSFVVYLAMLLGFWLFFKYSTG